jgi:adenine/guanine phosphoribosyltransferase-like PRPP-binding protein
MAKIIADALGGELDVVLVRKLGYPSQPELAIGAIDESGKVIYSDYAYDIDESYLEAEKSRQLEIIRNRRAQYTPHRPPIDPKDRIVIVVDDGIATGSTMTAALRAVRARQPKKLVGAVAVASAQAAHAMQKEADAMVCLNVGRILRRRPVLPRIRAGDRRGRREDSRRPGSKGLRCQLLRLPIASENHFGSGSSCAAWRSSAVIWRGTGAPPASRCGDYFCSCALVGSACSSTLRPPVCHSPCA